MSDGPRATVAIVSLGLVVGGCANPPAWWPAWRGLSQRQAVVAVHQQNAAAYERDGRLRDALDQWEVVATIDPAHAAARQSRQRLQARLDRELATHLRQGKEALERGALLEARRQFLGALALDPANEVAFEALRAQLPEVRWVTYTVRPGDTLAAVAERYYGDRSRTAPIGDLNGLAANARLATGTTLRIPEIPGVPFVTPDGRARPREEPRESHPLLLEARDAFEHGDYGQANASVDRLLASQPQNAEGLELKKALLYNVGRSQLEQQKWQDSYQTLSQLTRLAPSYLDAPALLRQVRDRLIQEHYSQGLRLFREEKLEEAIVEWRIVMELDPQHANARRNLEQAERLLKGLEERRKRP